MSRAYRLRVSESLRRVIKASDHVSSQLELLAVVPPEETCELLAAELAEHGFTQQPNGRWTRAEEGIEITVDAATASIEVKSTKTREVALATDKTGNYYDETNQRDRSQLEDQLRQEAREELEQAATDELERKLRDLQPELDRIVNRITAEGLKRKAARLGQIKEVTEDPQSGSLTIVVEV